MTDQTDLAPGLQASTFPYGRLTVAAGQTISSSWGNTTFDQTMQAFASASDRTNQWPSPNEGAQSWLLDSHTPWIYRAGAWHGLPLGYLGSVVGPATQTDCGATATTVLSVPVAVTAGRRYRVSAQTLASQQTATGNPVANLVDSAGYIVAVRVFFAIGLAVGNAITGSAVVSLAATTTATVTFSVTASSSAGVIRFGASQSQLTVEDIGS